MRLTLLAASGLAASTLALTACSPAAPATGGAASEAGKPADSAAPAHNMAAMDETMKAADAADDANRAETADGFTFHTYPAKVEIVHMPAAPAGGSWTATASNAALLEVGEARDETMPDGKVHRVIKVTPKASGNATVKFERRDTAAADAPVAETRTINFMVH